MKYFCRRTLKQFQKHVTAFSHENADLCGRVRKIEIDIKTDGQRGNNIVKANRSTYSQN